jgi:hypothetical protein
MFKGAGSEAFAELPKPPAAAVIINASTMHTTMQRFKSTMAIDFPLWRLGASVFGFSVELAIYFRFLFTSFISDLLAAF